MSGYAGLKRYINRADKKEGQSGGGGTCPDTHYETFWA